MLSISESPLSDISFQSSYLEANAVDSLPIRRTMSSRGRLQESVIHLHRLRNSSSPSALLRVRHIAIDYRRDFAATEQGIVPGSRIVGKMASAMPIDTGKPTFHPSDNLFVFPHSACWLHSPSDLCYNCRISVNLDLGLYETHRRLPCLRNFTYGQTIDGGLQDYIRVPNPHQSLLTVPRSVSLHDACFLLDIALPLYSFCKDHLLGMLAKEPLARVLVILNDSAREANDCLLVINHLDLEHLLITFVDVNKLRSSPAGFAKDFHHVLVFATGDEAVECAFAMSLSTNLESTKSRYSIALFGENADRQILSMPEDKTVYRVKLSYKDIFLMEDLLSALANFSDSTERKKKPFRSMSSGTVSSSDSDHVLDDSTRKKIRFKKHDDVSSPRRTHVSWLHCDADFKLCTEDSGEGSPAKCHSTTEINRFLRAGCQTRRVFYTNRRCGQSEMNAFIFSGN